MWQEEQYSEKRVWRTAEHRGYGIWVRRWHRVPGGSAVSRQDPGVTPCRNRENVKSAEQEEVSDSQNSQEAAGVREV